MIADLNKGFYPRRIGIHTKPAIAMGTLRSQTWSIWVRGRIFVRRTIIAVVMICSLNSWDKTKRHLALVALVALVTLLPLLPCSPVALFALVALVALFAMVALLPVLTCCPCCPCCLVALLPCCPGCPAAYNPQQNC